MGEAVVEHWLETGHFACRMFIAASFFLESASRCCAEVVHSGCVLGDFARCSTHVWCIDVCFLVDLGCALCGRAVVLVFFHTFLFISWTLVAEPREAFAKYVFHVYGIFRALCVFTRWLSLLNFAKWRNCFLMNARLCELPSAYCIDGVHATLN